MPPIYDEPIRLLMRKMAAELVKQPGQTFTKQEAIAWFAKHYPKIKAGSVTAHLIRLATNSPVRLHYHVIPGEDDQFFKLDGRTFRLYDAKHDPLPIHSPSKGEEKARDVDGEEDSSDSEEFAYERDLRNFLAKNLSKIEPGLKLYEEEGIRGIEYPVGGRFIDILAVSPKDELVVIELKVSRGYDRVVGQLMRYMA